MIRIRQAVCVCALLAFAVRAATQLLTLDEVLFRANETMVVYQQRFSGMVAEEQYTQRVLDRAGAVKETRTLVSDYLLIRMPQDDLWTGFRDVAVVDGKRVGERMARLQKLSLLSPAEVMKRARGITQEAAQYNIGTVRRNTNLPMISLEFLHPLNQHRFHFEKSGEETIDGVATWVVGYSEHVRPTMISSTPGDLFARGTFWLDPADGRVVRSEIDLGDLNTSVRTRIVMSYRRDATLDMWVPSEMTEQYENPRDARADRFDGKATYSNFRRFEFKSEVKTP